MSVNDSVLYASKGRLLRLVNALMVNPILLCTPNTIKKVKLKKRNILAVYIQMAHRRIARMTTVPLAKI
jgi:hypothetical protein